MDVPYLSKFLLYKVSLHKAIFIVNFFFAEVLLASFKDL